MYSAVEDLSRRPDCEPAVAGAEEVQHFALTGIQCHRTRKVAGNFRGFNFQDVVVRNIRQHATAVRRLPPEQLQWQLVDLVLHHLLGKEVADPGLLVHLRQLPVIAKRIRVPPNMHVDAEFAVKITGADEQLPHLRLTIRHVQIWLDPHASHKLPTALFDALLDIVKRTRKLGFHPIAILRRGLCERVIRIFIHEPERIGKGEMDLIHGLCPCPQPRCVDVRIPGHVNQVMF